MGIAGIKRGWGNKEGASSLSNQDGDAAHGQEMMLLGPGVSGPFSSLFSTHLVEAAPFSFLSPWIRDVLLLLGSRIAGATLQLQTALVSCQGGPNAIRREALEVLNDKTLISAGIYVSLRPCAGWSRALRSEKLPNWEGLDSLRLSAFCSSWCLLGMGNE